MKIHYLNLQKQPFKSIKEGTKRIEMRLFDEKRSLISVGDTIIFKSIASDETLEVTVISLQRFPTFKELYNHFDGSILGYKEGEGRSYLDMHHYYPKEAIDKYGVLAIGISLK